MVVFRKGHKNSKGEKAEWCIVSHKTKKILSSHKSKAAAKKHLQQMHPFTAYMQGGLSYDYGKLGVMRAVDEMFDRVVE